MGTSTEAGSMGFWQNAIREQAESGLSVKEYCQVIEKSRYQFYYWRQRIKGERQSIQTPLCAAEDFIEMRQLRASAEMNRCIEIRIGIFSLDYTSDTDQELFREAAAILLAVQNEPGVAG